MLNKVRPINKSFCLQTLCEDNYSRLVKLIPCFEQADNTGLIKTNVLDKAPFTYTLSLTPSCPTSSKPLPSITCRVYLDTKSVDIVNVSGLPTLSRPQKSSPKRVLNHKWTLNYFFEKWLLFQLQQINKTPFSQTSIHNSSVNKSSFFTAQAKDNGA